MNLLIKNIKSLVQVEDEPRAKVSGKEMATLNTIQNAWLYCEGDTIKGFGRMEEMPDELANKENVEIIDASGRLVLPTWCDAHTHLVFAGTREGEFVDRIKGLTYEEIAQKGGGILNSARKLQQMSEDELYQSALNRLNEIIGMGTGAVEIKSGYGLTVVDEIKILRVIKRLKVNSPAKIKATFLGAHAFPTAYKQNRNGYIDLIIDEMLPLIDKEGLADYIDVFCESNYFSVNEMERILGAGAKHGLAPKVHVNQFTSIGGIAAAVKHKARTVDHLEVMEENDIESLKDSETMPTLLPSCSFFIGIPYAPARKMIDAGLPVALATDYNPGSTPSGKMPFVISLACIKMKLTPEEAINAATINGAYAMNIEKEYGSIAIGKKANFFITSEITDYAYIPYAFGGNHVENVFLNGKSIKKSLNT
ncbi:MAG: imidazolonepropionase [Bacteroidetes bacterium]|nr:imidazolonepropionase [Bacteroidota bacterium]